MAIGRGRHIKINSVDYQTTGSPVLVPRRTFPPRIQSEPNRTYESLEEWEHYGMYSFVGGMGQHRFTDKQMFWDAFGLNVSRDEGAKLSRKAELVKNMTNLGVTLADLGGSCNISSMIIYHDVLYFGATEGDWGSGDGGKCRLWKWDGTTLTDLACTAGITTLATSAATGDATITVTDGSVFASGDYIYINKVASCDYELLLVTGSPTGGVVPVSRGQAITWAPGKSFTTVPQAFDAGVVVMGLARNPYDKLPTKAGDGIVCMNVFNDQLFVGTYTGTVFMLDNSTGYWYLQPPSPSIITYQGTSQFGGSINYQCDEFLSYKDIMYVLHTNKLLKYDPATGTGSNPWSTTLHTIYDSYICNTMVFYAGAIYIFSWKDQGDQATMYKYDGTVVTPIYRFPNRFQVHSAVVYDGKIFIGGGFYNTDSSAAIGQLYSYDGITMRKIFSRPHDEEFEAARYYTFYALAVWNDKLYFSDSHTTGLFCYMAEWDAIHRCYNFSSETGAGGDLVRACIQFQDTYYFSITSHGLYRVMTGDNYDVGGASLCYGSFLYPYINTSVFGQDFPNLEKMFFKLTIWHSPAVSGQVFHVHYSRNQQRTWSADHVLTPTVGSTVTTLLLMEEGWNDSYGGFDGTPTGAYGIQGMDLSLIIAMQTNSASQQFTLQGFAVAYTPIFDYEQRIRVTINCTENASFGRGDHFQDENWGIQRTQALWALFTDQRPILVEHLFDDRDTQKIMLMRDFVSSARPIDLQRFPGPTSEYPVENLVTIELVEVGTV